MKSNKQQFEEIIATGTLQLNRGTIFDTTLSAKTNKFDFDKVEGMLLALAIGDALGITTESMLPVRRRAIYGELRDYIPNQYVNKHIGFPSDDTQLTFWTLEQILEDKGFVPNNVADRICRRRIYGLGSTVRQFIRNYKMGIPWHKCGPTSAGNGALMRMAPMLIPHLRTGGTNIWFDTALSAMMTHNDYASNAACISFVAMLWELLDMQAPPPHEWWLDRYISIACDIEGHSSYRPRGGRFINHQGYAWALVKDMVTWADQSRISVVDACNAWHSGAFLLETIPSVIYILMRHGDNLEEAIVRAINDTKDNDTIAAIVGSMAGALHGKSAIPKRWIDNLSGRTTDDDDGRICDLISKAQTIFWNIPCIKRGDSNGHNDTQQC